MQNHDFTPDPIHAQAIAPGVPPNPSPDPDPTTPTPGPDPYPGQVPPVEPVPDEVPLNPPPSQTPPTMFSQSRANPGANAASNGYWVHDGFGPGTYVRPPGARALPGPNGLGRAEDFGPRPFVHRPLQRGTRGLVASRAGGRLLWAGMGLAGLACLAALGLRRSGAN